MIIANAVAELTPVISGLASGLRPTRWIRVPDTARAAPQIIAAKVRSARPVRMSKLLSPHGLVQPRTAKPFPSSDVNSENTTPTIRVTVKRMLNPVLEMIC